MTKVLNEVLAANARYADDFGDKSELPMPPGRRFAILTCMDARLARPSSPASPRVMPT
jgi:carbonic anhydrase